MLGIEDNATLSGVLVKSITPSGRIISSCTTSSDGCALAPPNANDVDKTPPFALIAQRDDDLTYLKYEELEAPVAESAVSGVEAENEPPYRVALFTERGVYRPGETAHATLVFRDKSGSRAVDGAKLSLELVDPRGRKTKTVVLKPRETGMETTAFSFSSFADTGAWKLHAKSGDTLLATTEIFVEEFVPERMKVTVSPKASEAEFRSFLRCGVLAHGFVRVRCTSCGHGLLVGFSCKRRAVCPSCTGRRAAECAAHLVDNVLPRAPVRQWVLTFPRHVRFALATRAAAAAARGAARAAARRGSTSTAPARPSSRW